MKLLAACGGGAFVIASLVVGLRLLLLARRTRALPELCMGLGMFLMGGIGYPLTSVARQALRMPIEARTGCMIAAHLCMVIGVAALAQFNWRVFRPASRRARAAALGIALALTGCFVAQGIAPGYQAGAVSNQGLPLVLITVIAGCALAWCTIEARLYARVLARRLRIGLTTPELADRVRLWTTSTAAATTISAWTTVLHVLRIDPTSAAGAVVIGPLGLLAAVALWLAFLPPAAYLQRVRRRAA